MEEVKSSDLAGNQAATQNDAPFELSMTLKNLEVIS